MLFLQNDEHLELDPKEEHLIETADQMGEEELRSLLRMFRDTLVERNKADFLGHPLKTLAANQN